MFYAYRSGFSVGYRFRKRTLCVSKTLKMTHESKSLQLDSSHILSPPMCVRGMKVLDRSKFNKVIIAPVLEVCKHKTGLVSKILSKYLLKMKVKLEASSPEKKSIVLNPVLVSSYDSLDETSRLHLVENEITAKDLSFIPTTLTYNNWQAGELLRAILPEDKENVAGYSIVGHIVHLNLRDHALEYKSIIGEILLDKVANVKTVVNKIDTIDSTYRNFKMEILCGVDDMITQVSCNHCKFVFDFSKVYWNPRLSTEHERIVKLLDKGDILYDVFSGVGPFAIPAGKKKCVVLANDLNPESYKWLTHNVNLNKVQAFVQTFNKDGFEFIKDNIKFHLLELWKDTTNSPNIHITMNLPELAVTFLSAFIGLFTAEEFHSLSVKIYPLVHVYCFVKGDNPQDLAKDLVERYMGFSLDSNLKEVLYVRNVAPMKSMMRVSFFLNKEILSGNVKRRLEKSTMDDGCSSEPDTKKICRSVELICNNGEAEKSWKQASEECIQSGRS